MIGILVLLNHLIDLYLVLGNEGLHLMAFRFPLSSITLIFKWNINGIVNCFVRKVAAFLQTTRPLLGSRVKSVIVTAILIVIGDRVGRVERHSLLNWSQIHLWLPRVLIVRYFPRGIIVIVLSLLPIEHRAIFAFSRANWAE